MASLNQDNRLLRIDAPSVGKDAFVGVSLHGEEALSELFQFEVELISTDLEIEASKIVGYALTASIHFNTEHTRYINGVVSQFRALSVKDGTRTYLATIVPEAWLLTLNHGSAIYSQQTTKDIVSDVLRSAAVPFKYNASANDKRDYCIQFQETDFEFVSRLLAEEGLSYYFTHADGKHEMIIVDKNSQYVDCDESVVDCEEENAGAGASASRVTQWQRQYQMQTGKLSMTGYLESEAGKTQKNTVATRNKTLKTISKFERSFYENSVPYANTDGLSAYGKKISQKSTAELILENEESRFDIGTGGSNCCSFLSGGRFELKHRLKSESGKYLITRVTHSVSSSNSGSDYSNQFCCIPATTPIHPAPPSERIRIHGPQLATVVEVKAGDSANANDPQLMVKVKFHWDDAQTSCWVRIMQNFAGSGQGAVFVPRVDSEVVVEFLGGDPDRPLVTGAVYNSDNKAPQYSNTQSGFKTGDKNFNELRFDDKKDAEEIYVKAGKDLNYLVVNDETSEIQNNQSIKVVKDRAIDVEGKEDHTVKGDQSLSVDGSQTVKVKGDEKFAVTGAHELKVTGSSTYKSSGAITIQASTGITLKVGSNKITIDNSGITIKGTMVTAKADANMTLKGGATTKVEGGAMTDVKSSGMLNLKGSMTKIN